MSRLTCVLLLAPVVVSAGQYRAFWADAFHYGFKTPAEVDQMLEDVVRARANTVFVEARLRGTSYYLKSLEPPADWDATYNVNFDALQYLIERAHARGIEVHAWFPVTPIWGGTARPTSAQHVVNLHGPAATGDQMWMTVSSAGTVSAVGLDPGHPAVGRYTADVIARVVENYDIDGVHLDFIRYYPETADQGYNPTAQERFRRLYNRAGEARASDAAWSDFRRAQVTAMTRQIYLRTVALKPRVKVSGALISWGDGPRNDQQFLSTDAYRRVFQNWRAWLEEGILDLGIPMNYFREAANAAFLDRWGEFEKDRQYRRGVMIGTAIYLNSIPESIRQATRALAPSAAGSMPLGINFYSYASTNTLNAAGAPTSPNAQFYDAIAELFRQPEAPPELPWKTRPETGHVMGRLEVEGGPGWLADGATVRLVHEASAAESVTETDGGGFFGFADRAPGLYHVRIERGGQSVFRSIQQNVAPGRVTAFDARLKGEDFAAVLPRFAVEGLANAASFQPGQQSEGALVSLFGQNLAPRAEAAARLPLPTELAGTQVLLLGNPVPLLYVSPTQINFQAPYFLALLLRPGNQYPIVVRHSGIESEARNLTLGRSVGIFSFGDGAAVFHASTFQQVTAADPARPDEYLSLYATGLGLTTPMAEAGAGGAVQEPFHRTVADTLLTLGNRVLPPTYSGLAPGLAGVSQVNFQVPADLPPGRARLILLVGGAASPPVEIEVR